MFQLIRKVNKILECDGRLSHQLSIDAQPFFAENLSKYVYSRPQRIRTPTKMYNPSSGVKGSGCFKRAGYQHTDIEFNGHCGVMRTMEREIRETPQDREWIVDDCNFDAAEFVPMDCESEE
jgi:hypothetical protein